MALVYSRTELETAQGLFSALQYLFPDFGDEELLQDITIGDATLHAVMLEFSSSFRAATSTPSQISSLANLIDECVAVSGELENAVGTCFLEHLRQIDRKRILWKSLSREAKAYVRAH